MTCDFEAYLPETFDDRPFGHADLMALEDEAGIERIVTMPSGSPPGGFLHPDNAGHAERIRGHPRLVGCTLVNPNLGRDAVDDFRRAVTEWGFRGAKVMPSAMQVVADSLVMDPVMEEARSLRVPVTIHSGSQYCSPAEIGRLAARHPQVPVIMDHMGYRAQVSQAIEAAKATPNLYLGTTLVAEPIAIKSAVRAVGAERVVFGSNAPTGVPLLGVMMVQRAGLSEREEALVLGDALASVYGLA